MIEHYLHAGCLRTLVAASCLAVLAGCAASAPVRTADTPKSAGPAAPAADSAAAPPPQGAPATAGSAGRCDGLADPGHWQEVSPPRMNKEPPYTGALQALVDPNNSGTLYVTTSRSGVFKSTDCGASWQRINTGRNGDLIDQGLVWSAVLDPVDSNTLYALTGYGPSGLWKSTNGGIGWHNMLPDNMGMPGFVARVGMDPTNHLHLLVNFHDNCTGGHTPVCFGETQDGGKTWRVLDFPPSLQNNWSEGTFILPIDATHWLLEFWGLYYTADAGTTWSLVDTGGAAAIQGPFYRTADGSLWLASQSGVLTSSDGAHWKRIPDSGGQLDGITACGSSLFAVVGFQVPQDNKYIYTATLADPTKWSVLQTPGLPQPMSSGANAITCDANHGILYVSAQGAGLWRMAIGTGN
jgi:photosystem II stability/assembly factor-like uncharacterized protein